MPEAHIFDSIAQFISAVGFPVAVAIYLLYYQGRKDNKTLETLVKMDMHLTQQIEALQSLNANVEHLNGEMAIWQERWKNKEFVGWQAPKSYDRN